MTGYGRAEGEAGTKKFTVEIKTLNSKQFDLISRIPIIYKEKELEIRSHLLQALSRGKIEITLTTDHSEKVENYALNIALAKKYFSEIQLLQREINIEDDPQIMNTLLKLPDVIQAVPEKLLDEEWKNISMIINLAVDNCDTSRINEGKNLEKDFTQRIKLIDAFLKEIEKFEGRRIERIREKFRKDLQKYVDDNKIDENRFEQEIIYYLEKIDITEEKVRLSNHCDYFLQTLNENHTSNGKKLNFISQEIGREINTIGSKANDSDIQKLVVQMKDELEKIKEQLYNIL